MSFKKDVFGGFVLFGVLIGLAIYSHQADSEESGPKVPPDLSQDKYYSEGCLHGVRYLSNTDGGLVVERDLSGAVIPCVMGKKK